MFRKSFHPGLVILISLPFLAACTGNTKETGKIVPTVVTTSPTAQTISTAVLPATLVVTPTPMVIMATSTADTSSQVVSGNPCDNMGQKYVQNDALGDIIENYVGSWHAAAFVGSGYTQRFVFFQSGTYLFFPSQFECADGDASCVPGQIEEGNWGAMNGHINLANGGDISNLRYLSTERITDSSPDESPYSKKTTFDGITYWLMSRETNLWNPQTGELCQ